MNSYEADSLLSTEVNTFKILKILRSGNREVMRLTRMIRFLDRVQSSADARKFLLRGSTMDGIGEYQRRCSRRLMQREELRGRLVMRLLEECEKL